MGQIRSPAGNTRAEDETKDNEPAYSASLSYLFAKNSSAFVSAKRSFRFPVSDELIQFFPTFQVNPSIKPQTGYHYEAPACDTPSLMTSKPT